MTQKVIVLILVLMEDALVQLDLYDFGVMADVLILVLMEDALVPVEFPDLIDEYCSLNPCFNGRCTRTRQPHPINACFSICLNPCFNGRCTRTRQLHRRGRKRIRVLILVLMEDALVQFVATVGIGNDVKS